MRRESGHLATLHTFGGLALGIAIPLTVLGGLAAEPLAQLAQAAATQVAARASGEGRAEIAVSFDRDGQIRCAILRRSTGSRPADEAAREAALQLAGLRTPAQVAGRTLVFSARFGTVLDAAVTPIPFHPADSMVAAGVG